MKLNYNPKIFYFGPKNRSLVKQNNGRQTKEYECVSIMTIIINEHNQATAAGG